MESGSHIVTTALLIYFPGACQHDVQISASLDENFLASVRV